MIAGQRLSRLGSSVGRVPNGRVMTVRSGRTHVSPSLCVYKLLSFSGHLSCLV